MKQCNTTGRESIAITAEHLAVYGVSAAQNRFMAIGEPSGYQKNNTRERTSRYNSHPLPESTLVPPLFCVLWSTINVMSIFCKRERNMTERLLTPDGNGQSVELADGLEILRLPSSPRHPVNGVQARVRNHHTHLPQTLHCLCSCSGLAAHLTRPIM